MKGATTFIMPLELRESIKAHQKKTGNAMGVIIRLAIAEYLEKYKHGRSE
jgi:predicted DNA-binding protein